MGLLIDDGYELDGCVPARGRYPAVAFRYRPALPLEVVRFQRANTGTAEASEEATVGILMKHLVSWDVRGKDDLTVPITPDTLRRLPLQVRDRLLDIITGYADGQAQADAKNSASG